MFEKFVSDVRNMPVDHPKMANVSITDNPAINAELLKRYIISDAPVSDEELYNIIHQSYKDVLRCIVDLNIHDYLQYCTTPKFITVLQQILQSLKDVDHDTRRYCNNIAYDYITMPPECKTSEYSTVADMMMKLSQIVNKETIRRLISIGLTEEIAGYIALSRYSTSNESTNIMRVNFILCMNVQSYYNLNHDKDKVNAEQLIVNIFQELYDHLSILFESTMFDVYDMEAEWMTDNTMEMYGIISMAVLDILNTMPLELIETVLKNYSTDYIAVKEKKNGSCPTRFSMRSLSEDFSRINLVVESLRNQGVYIP